MLIFLIVISFSKFYSSFFREHKSLRFYSNPVYWIYSSGKYIDKTFNTSKIVMKKIGQDAKIVSANKKKNIVVVVVGEAVRADRFSLNGYEKETNPYLKKEEIFNFDKFYSCGTSTAHSVPCMFSSYTRDEYTYKRGISTWNVLDILKQTGDINILWRDNNSDSKGVALRVEYEWFKSKDTNPIYDIEARDLGMIEGLDKYIENSKEKNILIVLHQMGNHGPAYYKRYPKEFEKFKPVCKTNQLEECTKEEISNAYDNAVLYTDYFLSKVINFLKPYNKTYNTSMLYMSDHGESLGENGVFLHGMPYFIAPDSQKHIAASFWFGQKNENILYIDEKKKYSHDNLFHTLLGLFDIETKEYDSRLDMLSEKY
jgi:lipid A ethanolaminephosphotransferase